MKVAGIYQIRNIVNGKVYVGSAVNIERRWGMHKNRLKAGQHRNSHLQRAWDKYGADAFEFTILEMVDHRGDLLKREQAYIDKLAPDDYNICRVAANSRLGAKCSPEHVEKLRTKATGVRHTDEAKAKMAAAKLGVKLGERSEAHKKALSESNKGRKLTDEHRARLKEAWVRRRERAKIEQQPNDKEQ